MKRPYPPPPYGANHERVKKARGYARTYGCEHCDRPAKDWAQIHGKDGADPADYLALCRSCHWHYDAETQSQGPVKRSQNPAWQASRKLIPRDAEGRYARGSV